MKGNNELKLIKDFITKINNGVINNKNKAGNEFRKLKQKVTNDRLRQDLIKDLERYLFGERVSITGRVKTRRQNKENNTDAQRIFAPSSSPKEDYSEETDEHLNIWKNKKRS